MRKWILFAVVALALPAHATVITGAIDGLRESRGLAFGELEAFWSTAQGGTSGWFYGSASALGLGLDVFDAGAVDPLSVTHAERFAYTSGIVEVFEGSTVFFRGAEGFGAWVLDALEVVPCFDCGPNREFTVELSGTWYFQDNGRGNFRSHAPARGDPPGQGARLSPALMHSFALIPEPNTAALVALGLVALARARSARSAIGH